MTEAKRNGRGARRRRKLEHVEPFVRAPERDIRAAYRAKIQEVGTVLELAWEQLQRAPLDSEAWKKWAARIDAVNEALYGWAQPRRARMLLLAAIDDAVQYFARPPDAALVARARAAHVSEHPTAPQMATLREAYLTAPTWRQVWLYERATGEQPPDATRFALFLFKQRCPDFAHGLLTSECLAALQTAISVWSRGPGRTKNAAPSKWEACLALMQEAGLPGNTPESLEADWREWKRRR